MAMPKLDPERFVHAVLADPSHKLPLPGTKSFFPAEGREIDSHDPYWRLPLADGSLKRSKAAPQPVAAAAEPVEDASEVLEQLDAERWHQPTAHEE